MKVTGTWEVPLSDPRRFVVSSWQASSLVLEDRSRGRRHQIVVENVTDVDNAMNWTDEDWWKFLLASNEF